MNANIQRRSFEASLKELQDRSNPKVEQIEVVQPRYVDWFEGERLPTPTVIRREETVVDIHKATRELTKAIMEKAGIQTYDAVSSRMPSGSRLRKAIEARALEHNPLHGVCRVGRVIVGRHNDDFHAAEFYLTNFDAKLSTLSTKFYQPTDRKGGMFFGVGVVVDQTGRRKRFDIDRGVDGMYFQTKDLGKAIYAIAAISTGMSIDQLMEIDRTSNNSVKRSRAG
jgi:hypothetical protein